MQKGGSNRRTLLHSYLCIDFSHFALICGARKSHDQNAHQISGLENCIMLSNHLITYAIYRSALTFDLIYFYSLMKAKKNEMP